MKRLVLMVVAFVGCENDPPPTPEPAPLEVAPPEPKEEVRPTLVKAEGRVERNAGAGWEDVKVGEKFSNEDAIRTAADATAELAFGDDSQITLSADSQVAVVEVSEAVQKLKVKRGRLSIVHSQDTGRTLRIEGENGEVVETRGARFDLSGTEDSFGVAATEGSVDLSAGGETIKVKAGAQSMSLAGGAPSAAAPIPTELLLKVARSATGRPRDLCALVKGQASPGSKVTVGAEVAPLDDDGNFAVEVPRQAGVKHVMVTVQDASGRERTDKVNCEREPEKGAPIEDLSIKWGSSP